MLHGHHGHCAHVLLYCSSCDVAYCQKCSREWGKYTNWYVGGIATTTAGTTYPNIFTVNSTNDIKYPVEAHSQGNHTGTNIK